MWSCDGDDDCGDNSDEDPKYCSKYTRNYSFWLFFWSIIADLVSCMQVIEQLPKTLLPS